MAFFHTGDKIEVASNQEGFWKSYWEATIVVKLGSGGNYVVEYTTLMEEDLTGPLRQVVTAHEVRPVPPEFHVKRFRLGDRVDAFENDGWWTGTVGGTNVEDGKYHVYFDDFKDEVYDVSSLRMHQDWNKGTWYLPSRRVIY